jgi:hypothetical protein
VLGSWVVGIPGLRQGGGVGLCLEPLLDDLTCGRLVD